MSRSLKKGPYVDERLIAKVERNQRTSNREPIKTWARDCTDRSRICRRDFPRFTTARNFSAST